MKINNENTIISLLCSIIIIIYKMIVKTFYSVYNRMTDVIKFVKQFTTSVNNNNVMEGKRQVVTRLKFIANICANEKIDSKNLRVESTSIWTPIKRFFTGDGRDATLSFFTSTIDRAFEVIDAHLHSKNAGDKLFCAGVITDLMAAVKGLRAFQQTYQEDKLISCEIDVIIESIQAKVYSVRSTHPDMFIIKKQFLDQMEENAALDNKMLSANSRVDKKQIYRISNGTDNGEDRNLSQEETTFPRMERNKEIKSNWLQNNLGPSTGSLFDPSLETIEEKDPIEND